MATLADLKLPDINSVDFTAKDGKQIKSYLYQLNEQLRYLLGNIGEDQLGEDVQDQLDLTKLLIDALGGGGTTININGGDRLTGWQPSDKERLTEQIKQIGERLGEGSTSSNSDSDTGRMQVVSCEQLPDEMDDDTIYLVRDVGVYG